MHTAGWAAGTRLTVYSTLGMAVVEQVLPSEGQTELPVGQLQPGTYICVAQDAAGHTDRQRLVISR